MTLGLAVAGIGFVAGVLSGLLGIGGGILAAPLLLYVPPAMGLPALSMHSVSGLTITQALVAGVVGALSHARCGTVDRNLAAVMAPAIFLAALAGAGFSRYVSHEALLAVFGALVVGAAVLLLRPVPLRAGPEAGTTGFSRPGAVAIASSVGFLGGLAGQGGSFLLVPAMTGLLRVPLRVAMGSNLVIVSASSVAGFLGKALTGQVPFGLALALVAGVVPGARVGSRWHHRTPTRVLRWVLGLVLAGACARIAWDLFGPRLGG